MVPCSMNRDPSTASSRQSANVRAGYALRRTRPPLSCNECTRRKIRCDKRIPCRPCVDRGDGSLCHRRDTAEERPSARARAALRQAGSSCDGGDNEDVQGELRAIKARLGRLEARLARRGDRSRDATSDGDGEEEEEQEEEREEPHAEFEENGLAGAMEEAALGIGETHRRQEASIQMEDATSPPIQNEHHPWFSPLSLDECLCRLPSRSQADLLVTFYFENLNWLCGCLHEPTFVHEYEAFWATCEQGGRPHDGTSLSLLFAVLSVAAYFLDDEEYARRCGGVLGDLREERRQMAHTWFDLSVATLFRCSGLVRPTLAACQIFQTLNYAFHLSGNTALHVTMTNVIVGFARVLNLHLLGSEHSGSGEQRLRREIGRRVWWLIVDTEWYFLPYYRFTSVTSRQFNTALPDLADDGTYASSSTKLNSLSFLVACCQSSRVLYNLYGPLDQKRFPPYETVLSASAELDAIVRNLPPELQQTPSSSSRRQDQQGQQGQQQHYHGDYGTRADTHHLRRFLGMLLAYRSYLIHRAYFAKSLRNPTYAASRTACVDAARTILGLSDAGLPATFYKLWNTTLWLVSTGIILALDLIYAAYDGKKVVVDAAETRARLRGLVALLQTECDDSGIAARGAKLIGHLCTIERDISEGRKLSVTFTPESINTFIKNDPGQQSTQPASSSNLNNTNNNTTNNNTINNNTTTTTPTAVFPPSYTDVPINAHSHFPLQNDTCWRSEGIEYPHTTTSGLTPAPPPPAQDQQEAAPDGSGLGPGLGLGLGFSLDDGFSPSGHGTQLFEIFDDWVLGSSNQYT